LRWVKTVLKSVLIYVKTLRIDLTWPKESLKDKILRGVFEREKKNGEKLLCNKRF
jgi:hypothetical protein